MSDPKRWLDGGADVPSEAHELLRHAAPTAHMPGADDAALQASIARIAAGGSGGAIALVAGKITIAKMLFALVAIAVSAGAIGIAVRNSSTQAPRHETHATARVHTPIVPAPAVVDSLPAPVAPPVEAAPAPAPTLQTTATALPTGHAANLRSSANRSGETSIPPDVLQQSVALLTTARFELQSNPAAALALLDSHTARTEAVGAEREFLAIEALNRLGRSAVLRARAHAFLARYPDSPYAPRVHQLADESH